MSEKLPVIDIKYPAPEARTQNQEAEFMIKVKSEKNALGRVEVLVNGFKTDISGATREMSEDRRELTLTFTATLKQGNNHIKILAYNEYNLPSYAEREITREVEGKLEKTNLHVLSIGVNEYTRGTGKNLKLSVKDAKAVAEVMQKQEGNSLYKKVNISMLTSEAKKTEERPTKANILNALNRIVKTAGPDDVVLIYYSGHGMSASLTGSTNLFYLVPEDFDWSLNGESSAVAKQEGVDAETLSEILSKMKAHKVVVIFDACHSGDVLLAARDGQDKQEENDTALKRLANGTGRFFFASSAGNEKSRENMKIGQGLFTYVLLNALAGNSKSSYGHADTNSDSHISLNEINTYISENFQKQVKPLLTSEAQNPIPMTGLGRYGSRSKIVDFPLIELKK